VRRAPRRHFVSGDLQLQQQLADIGMAIPLWPVRLLAADPAARGGGGSTAVSVHLLKPPEERGACAAL